MKGDKIMKKYILSFLTCILLIPAFTTCNMLDEVNYGSPTKEELTSNEASVVLMVGQAYADVKWLHDHWGYWGVNLLTADEGVCPVRMPGTHWSDAGYWRNLNTHSWNKFGKAFENIWNTTNSGAILCNKLIMTLDSCQDVMSPAVYHQYKSELVCLRSYYYFMLFDCFGRIPYMEKFEKAKAEPLMEPYMVWAHLIMNLEEAAKELPAVGKDVTAKEYYGRCSKAFAYTLLARLYLNAPSYKSTADGAPEFIDALLADEQAMHLLDSVGVTIASEADFYTNAARCCEEVISGNAGSYEIEQNYFSNFKISNQESKENIFVIVEDGRANFDYRDYAGSMANKLRITMLSLHYCHQNTWNLLEKPWNGFCARPKFIKRYNEDDVRGPGNEGNGTKNLKQWGWFVGPVYDAAGKNIQKDENDTTVIIVADAPAMNGSGWLDNATWNDGARIFKYEIDKTATYKFCENDFVLFRLADVYWMNEEALKRGGQGSSHLADPNFQTILARAFAYSGENEADRVAKFIEAYGDPRSWTLEQICDERGREFAWENLRRRDLIRFDQFETVQYVEQKQKNRRWFPIPYKVLENAERDEQGQAIWTQNPGY